MNKRGDGFTWVLHMFSCGWAKAFYPTMNDPMGTHRCLCSYLETGQFTKRQKVLFLQQVNTHYRKWCFANKIEPVEPPESIKKYFQQSR